MIPFPRVKERENRKSFKANASRLTLKATGHMFPLLEIPAGPFSVRMANSKISSGAQDYSALEPQ